MPGLRMPGVTPVLPPRSRAALSGLLAAAAGTATGELGGRLLPGATSGLLAVGSTVIDRTPTGVRETLVGGVGTADKPLLVTGVLLGIAAAGTTAALLRRRHPAAATLVVLALAVVAAYAGIRSASSSSTAVIATQAAAAAVALAVLRLLLPRPAAAARTGPLGRVRLAARLARPPDRLTSNAAQGSTSPGVAGLSRRRFLIRGTAVTVGTAFAGIASRMLSAAGDVAAARARVRLPRPVHAAPVPAADATFPVPGLSPVVTGNADFYRIDIALSTPQVDPARWTLTVGGLVQHELKLSYDDLLAMPQTEAWITMGCVGNPVGGPLVGTARWQGVLLADLLRAAGPTTGAAQVVGRSVDGYTGAFPLPLALDGRTALVALGMNGQPLPVDHGFPARLIVPGLYGYESAVKWLSRIELAEDAFAAYWVPRGYAKAAVFRTTSRIDTPRAASTRAVPAGVEAGGVPATVTVAGMAWAPHRGISRVEVSADGGPWQQATLAAGLGADAWRPWQWAWPATPGTHVLAVRATDGTNAPQDPDPRGVLPDGATGYHQVAVTVT